MAPGYGHFPIVTGVVLGALGLAGVVAESAVGHGLGWSRRCPCAAGRRCTWPGWPCSAVSPSVNGGVFRPAASVPAARLGTCSLCPPALAALGGVVVLLASLAAAEIWWYGYAPARPPLRGARHLALCGRMTMPAPACRLGAVAVPAEPDPAGSGLPPQYGAMSGPRTPRPTRNLPVSRTCCRRRASAVEWGSV